jgi:hypothetical protein
MIIFMRTTLVLEDRLFREAKQRAAAQGTTLSALVNEALRDLLTRPPPRARKFRMITSGGGKRKVHHEPSDMAQIFEDEDAEALRG